MPQTSSVYGTPDVVPFSTIEELPLTFDLTPNLEEGQVLSAPVAVLQDQNTGTLIVLDTQPEITGGGLQVMQWVKGSALTRGHSYVLLISGTVVGTTVTWAVATVLQVEV